MRFDPEAKYDANAGLHIARRKLEKIKKQFPGISYGDLWTLAGVVAVQEMVRVIKDQLGLCLLFIIVIIK